jgi:hypothetical protein
MSYVLLLSLFGLIASCHICYGERELSISWSSSGPIFAFLLPTLIKIFWPAQKKILVMLYHFKKCNNPGAKKH